MRCADCGYLSARKRSTRELCEVEPDVRQKWQLLVIVAKPDEYEPLPVCAAMAFTGYDVGHLNSTMSKDTVLQRERQCASFIQYMQGHNPREHRDMDNTAKLREFQERQRRFDRLWHVFTIFLAATVGAGISLISAYLKPEPRPAAPQPIHIHLPDGKTIVQPKE